MSRCPRFARLSAAAAVSFALVACGGDDDGGDVVIADSGAGSEADGGGSADCPAEASVGPVEGEQAIHLTQQLDGQEPDPARRLLATVVQLAGGDGAPTDVLAIEMWDGFAPFEGGQIAAGEYELGGEQVDPGNCGTCVYMLADTTLSPEGQPVPDKVYGATAGTLVVDSVGTREGSEITGNFTGSISGLTLSEIGQDSAPVDGGCQTAIESVTWDVPIENGDMGEDPPPGGDAGPSAGGFPEKSIAHRKVPRARVGEVKPGH